jgi:hypothetical protein
LSLVAATLEVVLLGFVPSTLTLQVGSPSNKNSPIPVGAVASSPPVLAVADFFKYLDQVELSIKEQFGDSCDVTIRTAMTSVNKMLVNNDPALVKTFNLCAAPRTYNDKANFVSDLMGRHLEAQNLNSILQFWILAIYFPFYLYFLRFSRLLFLIS